MDRTEPLVSETSAAGNTVVARPRPQSRIPLVLLLLLAAALVLRILASVGAKERQEMSVGLVRWQSTGQARDSARRLGRLVLYDFSAAWCQPCHQLDNEGWTDPSIAALVNGSFVPSRVIDREREDGKNSEMIEQLQQTYAVSAFPTLVAADSSGHEISRMEGYGGRERLIEFLQEAKKKAGMP